MKQKKRVIIEQGELDDYKRIILEEGMENFKSNTPKWDSMKVNLKEGIAEYGGIFVKSFLITILPLIVLGLILVILVIYYLFGKYI